eukprot:5140698-Amphidinium_carterae.1
MGSGARALASPSAGSHKTLASKSFQRHSLSPKSAERNPAWIRIVLAVALAQLRPCAAEAYGERPATQRHDDLEVQHPPVRIEVETIEIHADGNGVRE